LLSFENFKDNSQILAKNEETWQKYDLKFMFQTDSKWRARSMYPSGRRLWEPIANKEMYKWWFFMG